MDELNGADVDATSRLVRDEEVEVLRELAGNDDLLLVATRERGDRVLDGGQADVVLLFEGLRILLDDAEPESRACREGRLVELIEDEVFRDGEACDDAVGGAVLGDEADARVERLARPGVGDVDAFEGD